MSKRKEETRLSLEVGEPVKALPLIERRTQATAEYNKVLKDIQGKGKGYYPITVKGRKVDTVYIALSKRLKDNKSVKLHKIKGTIYLEVI